MDFQINKKIYFLIFIIFLGFFLRLYNINFEDLWFDEQASFLVADPKLTHVETVLLSVILEFNFSISIFLDI